MAKGVEDTAFYRYARLLALCDVGGDPGRFGVSVQGFHRANRERAERFPAGMLTTNTHDTKRSADVRARIAALTWIPAEWAVAVRRWLELTEELVSGGAPDDVERYFIFQTLLGAWPIEPERMTAYMEKALREAKRHTNWVSPDAGWEGAVAAFVAGLYDHEAFRVDFEPFVNRAAVIGDRIALGQVALKLTSPGVPDVYQGDELPFRALVDPDNRRPGGLRVAPGAARAAGGRHVAGRDHRHPEVVADKRLLGLRLRRQDAFAPGSSYERDRRRPGRAGVCARRRRFVAVATRAGAPTGSLTALAGTWQDVLRGGTAGSWALSELLDDHGIAVLKRAR